MSLSNVIIEFYEKMSSWEESIVIGTGVSLPKMHIIEIIGIYGSMRMKDLAGKIGITTGTLSIAIDKLEKRGFVKRVPNPEDRRSYLIALTPEGHKLYEKHNSEHINMTDSCLQDFSPEEQEVFKNLLSRFIEKI
ncbi:MAG: MarR family transcriptional regulator [Spirochaetales bacterium]|nr:MarR family transcriptional regulator [Spirochaetales bacterium]